MAATNSGKLRVGDSSRADPESVQLDVMYWTLFRIVIVRSHAGLAARDPDHAEQGLRLAHVYSALRRLSVAATGNRCQVASTYRRPAHTGPNRSYRAQPSRRSYIPKEDGSKRPLAVTALEDKACPRAVMSVFKGSGRKIPSGLLFPFAVSDAGMRGGGRGTERRLIML